MQRLLIIVDEAPVLHALRRLLQRHFKPQQLSVEICTNPLLALQRLQQERFDLLISDYRMLQLDGVTLLARARDLDPRAVRMMLSAAADFATVLAAVNRAGSSATSRSRGANRSCCPTCMLRFRSTLAPHRVLTNWNGDGLKRWSRASRRSSGVRTARCSCPATF